MVGSEAPPTHKEILLTKTNNTMKEYLVDMNITLSVRHWIDAETEEEAKDKALRYAGDNFAYMASQGLYVEAFVTDIIIQNK